LKCVGSPLVSATTQTPASGRCPFNTTPPMLFGSTSTLAAPRAHPADEPATTSRMTAVTETVHRLRIRTLIECLLQFPRSVRVLRSTAPGETSSGFVHEARYRP